MKRLSLILAAGFTAATMIAQTKAELKVGYTYKYTSYTDSTNVINKKMALLCNSSQAKYFNEMSEYCDSLTSTPEGKKKLQEIQLAAWMTETPGGGITIDLRKGNAPRKTVYTYIFTDTENVKVFDRFSDELKRYSEPIAEQEWEINGDSIATVLGYECIMATSNYHGRQWKAWFCPEIPVAFGPWKLRGLPGLILKAEANGGFSFEATGIEQSDSPIYPIYNIDDYDTTDRRKALADAEYYENHKLELLSAKYNATVKRTDQEPRPKYEARHAIECDYSK